VELPTVAVFSQKAPFPIIIGDSELSLPEHAVEMFRLLGGGFGDTPAGLPDSLVAVLACTSHVATACQRDLLIAIIPRFSTRRCATRAEG